jgi:hypothetical protein
MIPSAAVPAYIAVLCIFPFRLVTLQHVRTDPTCAVCHLALPSVPLGNMDACSAAIVDDRLHAFLHADKKALCAYAGWRECGIG